MVNVQVVNKIILVVNYCISELKIAKYVRALLFVKQ